MKISSQDAVANSLRPRETLRINNRSSTISKIDTLVFYNKHKTIDPTKLQKATTEKGEQDSLKNAQ